MAPGEPFVDYYAILRVEPGCDAKALEAAYHELLKVYHPDHSGTADTVTFNRLIEAYRVLRNPEQRAEYDRLYVQVNGRLAEGIVGGAQEISERTALNDAQAHARILMALYKARRQNAQSAGMVGYYLQTMLDCSDEEFEFHKWYLKEKGFIAITEQGTLAITIQGIDHVISLSRTASAEKLLIGRSDPHV